MWIQSSRQFFWRTEYVCWLHDFIRQAQHPLWACSQLPVGRLPRGCEQAPEGLWAGWIGMLGLLDWSNGSAGMGTWGLCGVWRWLQEERLNLAKRAYLYQCKAVVWNRNELRAETRDGFQPLIFSLVDLRLCNLPLFSCALSSELSDELSCARLEVGRLFPVDDVLLSKLVEHLLEFWEHCLCLSIVCCVAEVAEVFTHSLCVLKSVESSLLVLAEALDTWLVMCHLFVV